jgi:O-antigen biosynthesis protein WbqP
MKRTFDILLSSFLLILLFIPLLIASLAIKLSSAGSVLYWSERVGQHNKNFQMPKFRTMRVETPEVATHLLENAEDFYTPVGSFLRKTSLDELPQLYSIFINDMTFVGPRPALFNQDDLISMRSQKGVASIKPGVTGWAQVNGRDDISIKIKVDFDVDYLKRKSFFFDLYILWLTFLRVIKGDGVSH